MRFEAILFDKDGTLVDFHATYDAATALVLEKICGGNASRMSEAARVLEYDLESSTIGNGSIVVAGTSEDIARRLQPVLEIEDPATYGRYLDDVYGEICQTTVAWLPGARAVLDTLSDAGVVMGIATNDSEANARLQFSALNADHLFKMIIGADSGHGGKPGPGMVFAFAEGVGRPSSNVLMVGDSAHDLMAGKSAGAVTCAVETGPASRAELEHAADFMLESVAGLPGLVAS